MLARTLDHFDAVIAPLLTGPEGKEAKEAFKQTVRDEFQSLATDACDYLTFNGDVNGAAIELRDRVSPGAPSRPRQPQGAH